MLNVLRKIWRLALGIALFLAAFSAASFCMIAYDVQIGSMSWLLLPAIMVGAIPVAVFEVQCMYRKGIGILVLLLLLLQGLALGWFWIDEWGNFSEPRIYLLEGAILVFYAAGYAAHRAYRLYLEKQEKEWEIQMQARAEEERIRQEEQKKRQQKEREDAYYEDMMAQQRAYERVKREQQEQASRSGQGSSSYSGQGGMDEYEKAKVMFGLDSDDYTLEQIKKRRNQLMKTVHPDSGDEDGAYAQKVNRCFDILKKRLES